MSKKIVAFVPIKLNSERLPNKNILPINDKPLCYHLINTLCKINSIDTVYVYCSDERVKEYIPGKAVFLERDKNLDANTTLGEEIYSSFINTVDADIYCLAHVTSPFLKEETINEAIEHVISGENDSAFSAKQVKTFCWYKNRPLNYSLNKVPRTQDIEPIFIETSGFYIFEKSLWVDEHRRIGYKPYISIVDEIEGIDIDTKDDYDFAKIIALKSEDIK